jgi:hypothetical protein
MSKSFNLRRAEKTLRAGDPLSLDQVMALAEEGIDASVVEQRINEEAERGGGFLHLKHSARSSLRRRVNTLK